MVDTTNFVQNAFRLTNTERLHVTEKFRRVAADTVEYYVTIDDPSTWSRPWTLMILLKKTGERMFDTPAMKGTTGCRRSQRRPRAGARPVIVSLVHVVRRNDAGGP